MRRLRGVSLAPGLARGPLVDLDAGRDGAPAPLAGSRGPEEEVRRFREGRARAERDNAELRSRLVAEGRRQEVELLDALGSILADEELAGEVEALLADRPLSAEGAVAEVGSGYLADLSALPDPYLRERGEDLRELFGRLAAAIGSGEDAALRPKIGSPSILFASELSARRLAEIERGSIAGLALERASAASHAVLLARSLGVPVLSGIGRGELGDGLAGGRTAIIDGDELVLDPDGEAQERHREAVRRASERSAALAALRGREAVTRDGRRVRLLANVSSAAEAEAALGFGAEGIGLFRTEYLFLGRDEPPSEEEQYREYLRAVQAMAGREVVFRTMDVGGDKAAPCLGLEREDNPFLGYRAIRYCLDHPELLKAQLRAMLRSGSRGPVSIMFPMIVSVGEVLRLRALAAEALAELGRRGAAPAGGARIGIMVETPAAALVADELAAHVDFFSVGTNDLVQYTLAVDRGNPRVAPLYREDHPAVLRLVAGVVRAARRRGIPVCLCGEMAGRPERAELLVGLGLDELSMSPPRVPEVKERIVAASFAQAERGALAALEEGSC